MSNITKLVQNRISNYFCKLSLHLSKPESRCVREMTVGIIKGGKMLVNKIAGEVCDNISLSKTCERLRRHYNKKGFADKIFTGHIQSVKGKVHHGDYILVDGSDIQKKYAKMMEGLDFVKDGDTSEIGLGYHLMDVIHFSKHGEICPLYNKIYSFDAGAKSQNMEVMDAVKKVGELDKNLCYIYDRGMDTSILKEFVIAQGDEFVLRLKKSSSLEFKGKPMSVKEIGKKVNLTQELTAVKIKKNRKVVRHFSAGAEKVQYCDKRGRKTELWLVVTKNKNGGYCYLLTNSPGLIASEVAKATFTAYGHRWKIEEYHRHIKQCYELEDIQVRTFWGLESMLAILTVAMGIVYSQIESLHQRLILESELKTMNKNKTYELYNFIYYKISSVLKKLLAHVKPKAFLPEVKTSLSQQQLCFAFGDG